MVCNAPDISDAAHAEKSDAAIISAPHALNTSNANLVVRCVNEKKMPTADCAFSIK